jgi:hypothetical protein
VRYEQHQAACARARTTLLSSGWEIRAGVSGLIAEHLERDPSAPPRTIYGRDELELLRLSLRHD